MAEGAVPPEAMQLGRMNRDDEDRGYTAAGRELPLPALELVEEAGNRAPHPAVIFVLPIAMVGVGLAEEAGFIRALIRRLVVVSPLNASPSNPRAQTLKSPARAMRSLEAPGRLEREPSVDLGEPCAGEVRPVAFDGTEEINRRAAEPTRHFRTSEPTLRDVVLQCRHGLQREVLLGGVRDALEPALRGLDPEDFVPKGLLAAYRESERGPSPEPFEVK